MLLKPCDCNWNLIFLTVCSYIFIDIPVNSSDLALTGVIMKITSVLFFWNCFKTTSRSLYSGDCR